MATEIEKTIAANLRNADEEVSRAMLAYRKARRRRAQVYSGAAEVLSQKQIADLTGITQQRVSQVIQEANKKPPLKKVKRIRDA
jgi:transcriptional regulator with XRE-family HTH domain